MLETAGLNANEVSAYCRERGLYPEQVERWRQADQDSNEKPVLTLKKQKEIKYLKKELQSKGKDIVEMAALPVLHIA